ncbi:Maf family protein [bacterium]|nr:Maf family protein [bacterium]
MHWSKEKWTLASSSPRRLALLHQIAVHPTVLKPDVEEITTAGSPVELVTSNASLKANKVLPALHEGILIAADTEVVFENEVLGKPTDKAEARHILELLSDAWHTVYTGYSLHWITENRHELGVELTQVHFRSLNDDEIEEYVNSSEPYDKAGGYGIQSMGSAFVDRIEGCYFNVVGLPLAAILAKLNLWHH